MSSEAISVTSKHVLSEFRKSAAYQDQIVCLKYVLEIHALKGY